MTRTKRIVLGATIGVILGLATASAHWGPGGECAVGPGLERDHCYATSDWPMLGYPTEYVRGAVDYVRTQNAYGIKPCYYAFVTMETWLSFPGRENYIEAGNETNCEEQQTVHPFYASTKEGHQFAYSAPWTVPFDTYNGYWIFRPSPGGPYGIYFQGTVVKWDYGYPEWANEIENGMEVATGVEPHASGRSASAGIWADGSWHNYGAYTNPHPSTNGGLCNSRNPESNYPGNRAWSTCASGTRPIAEVAPGPDESGRLAEIWAAGEAGEMPKEATFDIPPAPTGKEKSARSLEKKALKYAAKQGSGIVVSAETGTLAAAQARLDPAAGPEAAPAIALARKGEKTRTVVMEGEYVSKYAKPGQEGPHGRLMAVVLNTVTARVVAQYIGDELPEGGLG